MANISVKEREWETQSAHTSRSHPRTFTTVRRYKIPEDLDENENAATRIVVREKERDSHEHERGYERDPRIQYRVVQRERDSRDSWERESRRGDRRDDFREEDIHITTTRHQSRSPSPEVEQIRITREVDRDRDHRPPQSPYLEKYSKSTEYFSQPAPVPIIIRERTQPPPQQIIIQETVAPQQVIVRRERDEPSYEIIEHEDVIEVEEDDHKSVASKHETVISKHDTIVSRREPEPEPEPEENYYYERRVIDRRPRPRQYDYEEEERDNRRRDRNYYSDDEAVYIRREYEEPVEDSGRHRRHIAEGVIGGIAASQLVHHHRKRQGEKPGSRVGEAVGYGVVGGIGAEALTRWNNRNRSGSRERDGLREGRRKHRRRGSGERKRSLSRGKALAGVAALAGLGAIAYAAGKKNNKTTIIREGGRSRSRRRRSSARRYSDEDIPGDKARDSEHRNSVTAKAGLVGAALAGLAQRARSQSRGGRGGRSKSRAREGIPIVGAGLASAAVAGLYERQKGKKEARRLSRSRSRSRSYSRSRSRSRSVPISGPRRTVSDSNLVEYGGEPILPSEDRRRGDRSRSRGRDRSSSTGSSPDRRRKGNKHRSRSRGLMEGVAAVGVAGVAANEWNKRKQRKKNKERGNSRSRSRSRSRTRSPSRSRSRPRSRSRSHQRHGGEEAIDYEPSDSSTQFYPHNNQFAPPPSSQVYPTQQGQTEYAHAPNANIPAYNPAEYGPTTGPTLPREDPYAHRPHHDPYAQQDYYEGGYPQDPEHMV